ncbi:elongation factor tu GTP binding domain-containing protein [Trichoderma breve]|uniref:Elongation factor tu GTP binding domain-containing protein n=1 Tax=Trichoderma breve TaxID=2034170 RepID=A0A9W9BCX7_9HYPO|nr:elongation factor tu GTP binding domain-containing protein [Trichoderma breve]KAJ4860144.1 elongation factor tu GTP binding domain-containing protein [Trichoderma breve]
MASVFTYDPDPPRVSSPWILADDADSPQGSGAAVTQTGLLSEYGVTRLEAEPQTGPIEYKLHLLLRSRRSYVYMSTVHPKRDRLHAQPGDGSAMYSASPASSNQPRQERLQRLTTQLLWRLQQSSPYHATSSREVRIPKLSDGKDDANLDLYGTQIPGLEESQGALYEIGVSDDGTLIGLTKDELDESIATLRIMAASLGCGITVLRMNPVQVTKQDKLWVAEALITPNTELQHSKSFTESGSYKASHGGTPLQSSAPNTVPGHAKSTTPQLRVTLTGPIASGKSSLLGTLSTGTLDNGRGKSRLSLLKHRHEMASGMTSSIAQELIGYEGRHIYSFSHRNIESWVDIHDYSSNGRLVFMSDSGGHPRYRHTVFRGLMNWAPHWMVLCIAADDAEVTPRAHDTASSAIDSGDTDLVKAHLDLSLKLDVPLAIVITKLDLASKPDQQPQDQLAEIPQADWDKHVPIVFTSVLKGVGVGLVHALLASLPLPAHDSTETTLQPGQPTDLFHIDDTFSLSRSPDDSLSAEGVIVSGHVRLGSFSVGQTIVVGPFWSGQNRTSSSESHSSADDRGSPMLNAALAEHVKSARTDGTPPSIAADEWQKGRIVSIRNLRLPVGTLEAGQVGSIGLVFEPSQTELTPLTDTPQIQRGMVMATLPIDVLGNEIPIQASRGFTATFDEGAAQFPPPGTTVNVLFACVRTAARILDVSVQHRAGSSEDIDDIGGTVTKVSVEFVHSRKWAELGTSVIIMGNSSQDGSGLQGFVGKITELVC